MSERPFTDDEFQRVMLCKVGGTTWSALDVYQLGEALPNWCAAVQQLGHANPGSTLDYGGNWTGHLPTDFVYDFVAWTSGRKKKSEGCDDRIRQEIVDSGWQRFALQRVSEALMPQVDETPAAAEEGAA